MKSIKSYSELVSACFETNSEKTIINKRKSSLCNFSKTYF